MFRRLFKSKPTPTISIPDQSIRFEVDRGKTMLEAALEQGVPFPHSCKVGTCGTCRYHLLRGDIRELLSSAMGLTAEQYQRGERLACQTLPKGDLEICLESALVGVPNVVSMDGVIVAQHQKTPDIIILELELDSALHFNPGQFAEITIPDANVTRSYSFANLPGTCRAEFHVRLVPGGAFSGWLSAGSRCGEKVMVRGPFGQFGLTDSVGPMICIAGGTGLAPIKSILQSMQVSGLRRRVIFMYGTRHASNLYFGDDVRNWKEKWRDTFEFVPVLSAEPEGSSWCGLRGFVTEHIPADIGHDWEAYLCGPPPMVDAAEQALSRLGVERGSIHADRFFDRSTNASV